MLNRFGLKFIFLLFFITQLRVSVYSQVAYHNFNSNDGLPSNEIYCVFQDHQGYLWFGTDHGVVKYNGYNFKTFTTADGLTDNTILDIKGDDENQIWFLTLSGGICYFDGKKFAPHPNNDTIKKLFVKRLPTSWEIQSQKQVWLGFVEIGIAKIDSDKAALFTGAGPSLVNNDSVRIYVLHLGRSRYVYTSFWAQKLQPIQDPHISVIDIYNVDLKFSRVNFNLLTLDRGGILMSLERFLIYSDSLNHVYQHEWPRNNIILKLRQTDDGKIWMLQKNNAGYSVQLGKGGFRMLDSITFTSSPSNTLLDHQGNQWITTLDQGIFMAPNQKIRIFNQTESQVLRKLSCINSNSKYLFVGLPEGQLLKIDRQFNPSITLGPKNVKDPTGIGSLSFSPEDEPQTNLDTSFWWYGQLDFYHTKILQISEQNYLVGATNGFALLTKSKKAIFGSLQSGFSKRVTEISKITAQKFLIGTFTGLYYYEPDNGNKIIEEPYFKNTRITAAKILNDKVYGVATRGKGIFVNINNKFYQLNEQRGIISDLAEDLYFENDSVLWEASFKGISKIYFKLFNDSLTTRVNNYTREDGLCSNQVNGIMGFNGCIWLATNEGLCYFRPEDLTEETALLPLYFGNISVNGIKRASDSLILNYDENNIFIEFNALYYKAIQGIRYKVRLKGVGPWKYTDLNYIQYFNLPPGEYQMQVAADDRYGKYRSEIHSLNFTIKPRFVDTFLFRLMIGLIILLIAALIVYMVFSYQKLKATNIIKLLQAEFKALSYQINPHFIFNVLNSIQYYILKKDTDNAIHLLGSFSLLIRRIVNNSRQQYIGIIEEVECLREYMDLEKMRLDNKFDYTINIDSSIDVEDKNILPMIIQPLVENSIWHGIVPSSKHGAITIDFKKEKGAVICTVTDNGVGINATVNKEKSQSNLSLAMKNVSERLKIISELNDSTWAVKTIDRSVADPEQSGTIVTIIFPALKNKS